MGLYGIEFIDLLKKDGRHGDYFQYEEYQRLSQCSSGEDFRALILKTEFHKTEVSERVSRTYRSFTEVVDKNHKTQSLLSLLTLISSPALLLLFTLVREIPIVGWQIAGRVFKTRQKELDEKEDRNQ